LRTGPRSRLARVGGVTWSSPATCSEPSPARVTSSPRCAGPPCCGPGRLLVLGPTSGTRPACTGLLRPSRAAERPIDGQALETTGFAGLVRALLPYDQVPLSRAGRCWCACTCAAPLHLFGKQMFLVAVRP
jgi:hypothetical protein